MWIIAGPNGAGKSSFAGKFLPRLGFPKLKALNADVRTLHLRKQFPDRALSSLNLQAAEFIDAQVAACIAKRRSFVVETVLSSDKYRDDVIAAKLVGMKFGLIYVSLYPPELSPQRVQERVAKGGHDVEPATAIKRYARSHQQLRWFAPKADLLMIFDNSSPSGAPVLVAQRLSGKRLQHLAAGTNPAVDAALVDMLQKERPGRTRRTIT